MLTVNPHNTTRSVHPLLAPFSVGDQPGTDTILGVVVGIAMFLFLVVLALVGLIVLAVLLKRRAAYTQTTSIKMRDNPSYNNPVVVEREERDEGTDYEDVDKNKEQISSMIKDFDLYVDVNRKGCIRNEKKLAQASPTPASATDVGELYAVVGMSKKKGAKKKEEDESTVTNKDDWYTMPVKKDKMAGEGMGASGGAEKSEDYDDVVELKYEPKTDSDPGQQSEGEEEKSSNADMHYAVVDKCL